MGDDSTNGRTHEPNLREITAELDGLKDLMLAKLDAVKELMTERDRLYKERDESRRIAVDAALAAAKEQTKASFDASEKAIGKAEEAQKAYNTAHNDLSKKLDEQNKATIPRLESEQRMKAIEIKIDEVRSAVGVLGGHAVGGRTVIETGRANLMLVVAACGSVISAAMFALLLVRSLLGK